MSSKQPRLLVHQERAVLTVTFNNPPRHFFDAQMAVELDEFTRTLKRDKSVRVVIFTGTENIYITHMDVATLLRVWLVPAGQRPRPPYVTEPPANYRHRIAGQRTHVRLDRFHLAAVSVYYCAVCLKIYSLDLSDSSRPTLALNAAMFA